jgi:hypothetical protein
VCEKEVLLYFREATERGRERGRGGEVVFLSLFQRAIFMSWLVMR